jgi:hypothetical protein
MNNRSVSAREAGTHRHRGAGRRASSLRTAVRTIRCRWLVGDDAMCTPAGLGGVALVIRQTSKRMRCRRVGYAPVLSIRRPDSRRAGTGSWRATRNMLLPRKINLLAFCVTARIRTGRPHQPSGRTVYAGHRCSSQQATPSTLRGHRRRAHTCTKRDTWFVRVIMPKRVKLGMQTRTSDWPWKVGHMSGHTSASINAGLLK